MGERIDRAAGETAPWPPSRERLAAAVAAGETLAAIARRHGRARASVSALLRRYGLVSGRALGVLRRPDRALAFARARAARGAAPLPWPPTEEAAQAVAAAGYGDRRAAALFGVHMSTYRAWRRRQRADDAESGLDGPPRDPAAFGFDAAARWPSRLRFEDDPRATAADRIGRIARPVTIVEGASSLALLAG
ncbi:MAG: helix-turn-helix domain-containing protein [Alphaproteobacteria bacterium]|nr:helix-turn-helix domain-containing protein [Alphaproteobacteria bacterium]